LHCEGHHRSDADCRAVWRDGYGESHRCRRWPRLAVKRSERRLSVFWSEWEFFVVGSERQLSVKRPQRAVGVFAVFWQFASVWAVWFVTVKLVIGSLGASEFFFG
jgi:hypothetical protein